MIYNTLAENQPGGTWSLQISDAGNATFYRDGFATPVEALASIGQPFSWAQGFQPASRPLLNHGYSYAAIAPVLWEGLEPSPTNLTFPEVSLVEYVRFWRGSFHGYTLNAKNVYSGTETRSNYNSSFELYSTQTTTWSGTAENQNIYVVKDEPLWPRKWAERNCQKPLPADFIETYPGAGYFWHSRTGNDTPGQPNWDRFQGGASVISRGSSRSSTVFQTPPSTGQPADVVLQFENGVFPQIDFRFFRGSTNKSVRMMCRIGSGIGAHAFTVVGGSTDGQVVGLSDGQLHPELYPVAGDYHTYAAVEITAPSILGVTLKTTGYSTTNLPYPPSTAYSTVSGNLTVTPSFTIVES